MKGKSPALFLLTHHLIFSLFVFIFFPSFSPFFFLSLGQLFSSWSTLHFSSSSLLLSYSLLFPPFDSSFPLLFLTHRLPLSPVLSPSFIFFLQSCLSTNSLSCLPLSPPILSLHPLTSFSRLNMTLFYYHVFSPFSHFPSCVLLFPLLFSPFFLQLTPILLPPHLYFCIPLSPFSCLLLLSCPALCVSIHVFFPLVFSSCDFSSSTFFPLISFSLSSNFLCCPHLLPFPFTLNSFPFFHLLSVMPFHLLFIISLYSPSCLPVSFPPPSPPIIYNPLLPSFVISFNLFFFSPFATSPSSILLSSTCHLHTFLSPFPVFFPASFLLSPHPLHSCFLSTPFLFVLLGFLLSSPRLSSHLVPAFPPLWNAALFCFDLFIR